MVYKKSRNKLRSKTQKHKNKNKNKNKKLSFKNLVNKFNFLKIFTRKRQKGGS